MSERHYLNENAQQKTRKPDQNTPDAAPEVNDLVKLQGVVGNQGVQRLLAGRKLTIQPKLNVTPAGDQYEQEADTVAKQVVQHINQPAPAQRAEEDELQMQRIQRAEEEEELMQAQRNTIQRAEEDELQMQRIQRASPEEEEPLQAQRIQRVSFENGGPVNGDIESTIESARSSGQAMDSSIRGQMENAFSADFSGVRVHTDAQSHSLNQSIQAKAFTTGSDIFFSKGAYDPASPNGQELLGHELTHVVQQNAAVQKKQDEYG